MEETISRMAGAEWGIRKEPEEFDDAIRAIGRVPAVRTTTYERVDRTPGHMSICLTVTVKLLDRHFSSLGALAHGVSARHDGRDKR